jgi:hypothetical protein
MIFTEPEAAFIQRRGQQPVYERPVVYGPLAHLVGAGTGQCVQTKRLVDDDFWTELALKTVGEHGDEPMAITSLANALAQGGNFSRNTDREAHKIKMFRLIGRLIQIGRLDRFNRKFVKIPLTDTRYKESLASLTAPIDLPSPLV